MEKNMDYRDSHLDKNHAISYKNGFIKNKYQKYIWSREKKILNEIKTNYFEKNIQIKYLDFACGTGRIISFLEKDMFESYGVDVSESMLKFASENTNKSKIINVDLTKKNIFDDNYFDFITAFRFFLNAQEELREDALHVISKILKKDGFLVFNIHLNKFGIYFRIANLFRKIKSQKYEIRALNIKEVNQMVEQAGLQIISIYHYGIVPIFQPEKTKIPIKLIDTIEKIFSAIPFFKNYSNYVIFVCKHNKE
jgi:ubiquinone/menaquinone biosynthesis C-methylase UbiE